METMLLPGFEPYRPLSRRRHPKATIPMQSAADVFKGMKPWVLEDREHLIAFDLDARNHLIARRVVSVGVLNEVAAHPREVFRPAIVNGAAAVIVAHNHPSGVATPSREDGVITRRLREVGELVGVPLLDHVVVAKDGFTSIADTPAWGVN